MMKLHLTPPSMILIALSLLSLTLSMNIALLKIHFILEINMITLNPSFSPLSFTFDPMSGMFLTTVLLITTNISIFSYFYMMKDSQQPRFLKILLLFVTSMAILVFSGNFIMMFVGWDGLGMTSFLLVSHYLNFKSMGGAMITLMSNRVGDATLLITLSLTLTQSHLLMDSWSPTTPNLTLFLLLSAATKSAQIPYCMWLPEAMSAPTPVSALVHSSTLVTAGVYVLTRYSLQIQTVYIITTLMMYVGLWTAMVGGMMGLATKDTKKMVAISTLSQLGFMISNLSMGLPLITLLHLITHANFKALLFMTVGANIMSTSHSQMLTSNNTTKGALTISTSKLISLTSLNALPYTAGFHSKDLILETMLTTEKLEPLTALYLATTLTTLYSLRLWNSSSPHTNPYNTSWGSLSHINMLAPFTLMSLLSVTVGSTLTPSTPSPESLHLSKEHMLPMLLLTIGLIFYLLTTPNTPLNFLSKSMFLIKKPTKLSSKMTLKTSMLILTSELSLMNGIAPLLLSSSMPATSNTLLMSQSMNINNMVAMGVALVAYFYFM